MAIEKKKLTGGFGASVLRYVVAIPLLVDVMDFWGRLLGRLLFVEGTAVLSCFSFVPS
jgi:hypothetical protein